MITKKELLDSRTHLDSDAQKRYDEISKRIDGAKSFSQKLRFAVFEDFRSFYPGGSAEKFEEYYSDYMELEINRIVTRVAMRSEKGAA